MERCLSAYSAESWDELIKQVKAMPKPKQKRIRQLFSHAAKCEVDAQGRILIPQNLRDFAGLKKNVSVVGAGDCVEFWDSDVWAEVDAIETTPENIAEVYMELDF
jgi:MraZ protein